MKITKTKREISERLMCCHDHRRADANLKKGKCGSGQHDIAILLHKFILKSLLHHEEPSNRSDMQMRWESNWLTSC